MNRTDRLYALVEELRARAPRVVRAAALAARFEVTTRTIERDLLALQEAGVPIWAQPRPGGGYGLNADTTLPPLNLTPAEAAALATALAVSGSSPFAEAGRSALQKLAAVMALAPRDGAAALVSRIRITRNDRDWTGPVAEIIQQALIETLALELTYRDRNGSETVRTVEPGGIFGTKNGWFLLAWCRLRQGPRAFRLDRISRVEMTDEHFTPRPLDSMMPELPYDMAPPVLP